MTRVIKPSEVVASPAEALRTFLRLNGLTPATWHEKMKGPYTIEEWTKPGISILFVENEIRGVRIFKAECDVLLGGNSAMMDHIRSILK